MSQRKCTLRTLFKACFLCICETIVTFAVFKNNAFTMNKRLTRSRDRMIAGVCGGIAEYYNLDPTLVRVGYVLLSICSAAFPGLLVYLILWLIMPER